MTNDHTIEDEIQAKGKTAPRVTPADIEANIRSVEWVTFTSAGGQVLRWAVITTSSGYAVVGRPSVAVSPENDDADIGQKVALENSKNELWPLMGYALKNELSRPALTEADALADLRGEPRPDWSGYSNEKVPAYTWADVAGYEVRNDDFRHQSVFDIRTKDGKTHHVTLNNHTYRGLADAIPQLVEAMNKPTETVAA